MKDEYLNPLNGSGYPCAHTPSRIPSRNLSTPTLPAPLPSDLSRLILYKSILSTSPDWPRERRQSFRIKQSELAYYLSISQPCLSFWESGETKPDDSRLLKWFDVLLSLDVPDKIKQIWGVVDDTSNPNPNPNPCPYPSSSIAAPPEQGDLF